MKYIILMFAMVAGVAQAQQVIEYSNGYNLVVPAGWEVSIHPKGFNSEPYDPVKNPQGKLAGWGGWPWYSLWLKAQNCAPGELVVSPSSCPPQPHFTRPDQQCYFEPLEVTPPEECLVISPGSECEEP
jgi:hypothetical protein